ncbi:hypothetical protein V501_08303 [Pseudogymnoascus sp. VKM F-4519 (FW-2642)]|nr:hypothetical protein V501_08303 [Pseudogymnoascus sp. VKM F-4519 (FW-2642)]
MPGRASGAYPCPHPRSFPALPSRRPFLLPTTPAAPTTATTAPTTPWSSMLTRDQITISSRSRSSIMPAWAPVDPYRIASREPWTNRKPPFDVAVAVIVA